MRASMGPQLYRCGNAVESADDVPSDSYRFNGAATLSLRKFAQPHKGSKGRRASMGPQLYRCGNSLVARLAAFVPDRLQWGRNFIVAEMSLVCFALSRETSFNGAATLSLRKSFLEHGSSYTAVALQWGRNFIVAEMSRKNHFQEGRCPLQWGRNFIVAEIRL